MAISVQVVRQAIEEGQITLEQYREMALRDPTGELPSYADVARVRRRLSGRGLLSIAAIVLAVVALSLLGGCAAQERETAEKAWNAAALTVNETSSYLVRARKDGALSDEALVNASVPMLVAYEILETADTLIDAGDPKSAIGELARIPAQLEQARSTN